MSEHLAEVRNLVDPKDLPEADKRRAAEADAAADPALTGAALARKYGKDARWGRHRIDKVRPRQAAPAPSDSASPAPPAPVKVPPAPPGAAPASPQVPPRRAPAAQRQPAAAPPAPPEDRWYDTAVLVAGRWAVLLVAAALSYSHMRHLADEAGEEAWRAAVWPVSVDGLLVVALVTLRRARRHGEAAWGAWAALVAALGASLTANVASAQPTALGRFVAAWPPLVLLAVEVLGGRRHRQAGR